MDPHAHPIVEEIVLDCERLDRPVLSIAWDSVWSGQQAQRLPPSYERDAAGRIRVRFSMKRAIGGPKLPILGRGAAANLRTFVLLLTFALYHQDHGDEYAVGLGGVDFRALHVNGLLGWTKGLDPESVPTTFSNIVSPTRQRQHGGLSVGDGQILVRGGLRKYRLRPTLRVDIQARDLDEIRAWMRLGDWPQHDSVKDAALAGTSASETAGARARPSSPTQHEALIPRQLGRAPATLFGRDEELHACAVDRARDLLLHGAPGVGKTTLARTIGHHLDAEFPDGQIELDLRGSSESPLPVAEAMRQVILAFRPFGPLNADDEQALAGLYRSVLARKRALLLFDDALDRRQIDPLLPPKGCRALITSRTAFSHPEIVSHEVRPLTAPESVALLQAIAPRIDTPSAEAIAAVCGAIPAFLCTAAGIVAEERDLDVPAYMRALESTTGRLRLLEDTLSNIGLAALASSLRTAWQMLSVCGGDFDVDAAVKITHLDEAETRTILGQLVKRSFLHWDSDTRRYGFHDLWRTYAFSKMDQAARLGAEERHANHFMNLAMTEEGNYRETPSRAFERFHQDWHNVRSAFCWAMKHAGSNAVADEVCCKLPVETRNLLTLHLSSAERIEWSDAGAKAARRLKDARRELLHLGAMAVAYEKLDQPRRSLELYAEERAILRRQGGGDPRVRAAVFGGMGTAYATLGQPHRAIWFYRRHIRLARAADETRPVTYPLIGLASAYVDVGRPERALRVYDELLPLLQGANMRRLLAQALAGMGRAYNMLARPDEALSVFRQAQTIAAEFRDRRCEAYCLGGVGMAHLSLGHRGEARSHFRRQLRLGRTLRDNQFMAFAFFGLARTERASAHPKRAAFLYDRTIRLCESSGDIRIQADAAWESGELFLEFGQSRVGSELLKRGAEIKKRIGHVDAERYARRVKEPSPDVGRVDQDQ